MSSGAKGFDRERRLAEKRERERERRRRLKEAAAAQAAADSGSESHVGSVGVSTSGAPLTRSGVPGPATAADVNPWRRRQWQRGRASDTSAAAAAAGPSVAVGGAGYANAHGHPHPPPTPSAAAQAHVNVAAAKKVWEEMVRGSGTFAKLAALERDVDREILRRQHDLQRALHAKVAEGRGTGSDLPRIFRVYLFHEVKAVPSEGRMWTLRIQGWPMPHADEAEDWRNGKVSVRKRCSQVFRRVVVELDRDQYPEDYLIEWNRGKGPDESCADGWEITRPAKEEFVAKICLTLDHEPERFKCSPALKALLGVESETRSAVYMSIWRYIKEKNLQAVDDKTIVVLDERLRALFDPLNQPSMMKLSFVYEVVKTHLSPLDPIDLEYHVTLPSGGEEEEEEEVPQDCYDIKVHINEGEELRVPREHFTVTGDMKFPNSEEYTQLNAAVLDALEQIGQHRRRKEFFERFVANPVGFINHLILSQTRDLRAVAGSSGRTGEEERRATFYQQQWVSEAVPRYLLKRVIAGTGRLPTK